MAGELNKYAEQIPRVKNLVNQGWVVSDVDLIDGTILVEKPIKVKVYQGGKEIVKEKLRKKTLRIRKDEHEFFENVSHSLAFNLNPPDYHNGVDKSPYHISRKTTGMPYYDEMLAKPEYFREQKGRIAKVTYMSPDEYLRKSYELHREKAREHGKDFTFEEYMSGAVYPELVNEYTDKMRKGEEFPMPVIDYALGDQEGRHRAVAAKELGIKKIPVMEIYEAEPVKLVKQMELTGKPKPQTTFAVSGISKPRSKRMREKIKPTKQKSIEKYGAEIREKGKPKLDEFATSCASLLNNVWKNDIAFIDSRPLKDEDFIRIWNDIQEHRYIAVEREKQEGGNVAWCDQEWEKVMEEFDKRLGDRKIYTDWEARQIDMAMSNSGIEYPTEIIGSVKEKGYSTHDIDIKVDCSDDDLNTCAVNVKKTIGCKPKSLDDNMLSMECEVIPTGRKVPVDFLLTEWSE